MAFFEALGKRISDAGQGAAQQAKNFAEVTRLNGVISDKEKRIAQLYSEIGQVYYDRHKNDPDAECKGRINEINSLFTEIEKCKENIEQIKGVNKCPNCGADVPANAGFCNACGARIPQPVKNEAPAPSPDTVLCPNCHTPLPAGSLFCGNCGTRIETTESEVR